MTIQVRAIAAPSAVFSSTSVRQISAALIAVVFVTKRNLKITSVAWGVKDNGKRREKVGYIKIKNMLWVHLFLSSMASKPRLS